MARPRAAGPAYLVKDINADPTTSPTSLMRNMMEMTNVTVVGDIMYFSAHDERNGLELWKSDGTAAGTVLVRDIMPGAGGSVPSSLTDAGGKLFFAASDGSSGYELWRSDGTEAGTVMVQDIAQGVANANPSSPTVAGGYLFFSADDGIHGRELWALPLAGHQIIPTPATTPTPTTGQVPDDRRVYLPVVTQ